MVGDTLAAAKDLKDDLAGKDLALIERLARQVERGALSLYTPSRMIHSKLFVPGVSRAIVTSANPPACHSDELRLRPLHLATHAGQEALHSLQKGWTR